ncbi:MAG: FecR family protein [Myxococcota bacterium]
MKEQPEMARVYEAMRSELDRQRPKFDRAFGLRAVLAQEPPSAPRAGRLRWAGVSAAAVALGLLLIILIVGRPTPRAVDGPRPYAAVDAPQTLVFADGTTLVLDRGSQAEVISVAPSGATLDLNRGQARFRGEHRAANAWQIRCGPYEIRILGTRFTFSWAPHESRLEVHVHEGEIEVRGPELSPPAKLGPGDRFSATSASAASAPAAAASPSEPTAAEPSPPPVGAPHRDPALSTEAVPASPSERIAPPRRPAKARSRAAGRRLRPAPTSAGPKGRGDWKSLIRRRAFSAAVEVARAYGLEALCREEPPSALLSLVDAARYSRDRAAARTVLLCVRTHHSTAPVEAPLAAYLLGRLAMEREDRREARTWFVRYFEEAPHGPLAEQALGELVALGGARAATWADLYLQRFPQGPFAQRAQRALEPASP